MRLRCCRLWNGVVGVSSRALLRNRAPRQKRHSSRSPAAPHKQIVKPPHCDANVSKQL